MIILGIETTCDETAASVVEDGNNILSNIVASQDELHHEFGGVVPEIACRAHLESIVDVIDTALLDAKVELSDIDAVAVANTPGLVGAILIGLTAAKSIAWAKDIPIIGVTHIHAHLYSMMFNHERAQFPLIGLIVSGGHTSIFLVESAVKYTFLGGTLDDAAGEAFDKVAKILGLGYPGGHRIDEMARNGNREAVKFPRSYLSRESLDFSFSGLKTAVLYHYHGASRLPGGRVNVPPVNMDGQSARIWSQKEIADICASFQEAVVDVLVDKTILAYNSGQRSGCGDLHGITVGGGVARNSRLRERLQDTADRMDIPLYYPQPALCTDNAAMIAGLAYHKFLQKSFDDLSLEAIPNFQS